MDGIKSAVMAVCVVSAAICAVENLVAGTRLKTQMRLLLNLILALVLITPFVRGGVDLYLPEIDEFSADLGYSQKVYAEELSRQTAENVSEILREQIIAAGIECYGVETEVNISEDMSISISRVTVSAEDFEAAAEIVRGSLGSDTEVANGNT